MQIVRQGDLFNNDVRVSDISYGDLNLDSEWICPIVFLFIIICIVYID